MLAELCSTGGKEGRRRGSRPSQDGRVSDLTVIFPMEKDFHRKG